MSTSGTTQTPSSAPAPTVIPGAPQPPEALVLSPKDTEHATTRQSSLDRLTIIQPTPLNEGTSASVAPILTSSPTAATSPTSPAYGSSGAANALPNRPERSSSLTPPGNAHGSAGVEIDLESGRYRGATGAPVRSMSHTGATYNRRRTNPPAPMPVNLSAAAPGDGGEGGGHGGAGIPSWIVPPASEKTIAVRRLTIRERLQPTLDRAQTERDKYAIKARNTGYALNAAIGAQVVLGTLTTGLSAALSGKSISSATAFLGGLSTVVASYLARARGSNEPELSISRTKDLEQFIRECQAFELDHGHLYGVNHTPDYNPEDKEGDGPKEDKIEEGNAMERYLDAKIEEFRNKLEEMLGNGSGQRKLSEPLSTLTTKV